MTRNFFPGTEGLIDHGTLIVLGLQRSKTAREAIKVMTELLDTYGYASEGESFTIADPTEVFIMELTGKGKGYKVGKGTFCIQCIHDITIGRYLSSFMFLLYLEFCFICVHKRLIICF